MRSYGFLDAILSYGHPVWEKLSIFLNFLIPKLPAPKEEGLSKGVLETIELEHDRALGRVVLDLLSDHTELFKQFSDNPSFKRWLSDTVFDSTYRPPGASYSPPPRASL